MWQRIFEEAELVNIEMFLFSISVNQPGKETSKETRRASLRTVSIVERSVSLRLSDSAEQSSMKGTGRVSPSFDFKRNQNLRLLRELPPTLTASRCCVA